ncbi:MAG: hypothetical protein AAGA24_06945 [Pseudomonadota bacterium]
MASRWKHREHRRRSTWRQSLLFNSLLLLLPVLAARVVWDAYTTDAMTDPTSIEARTETRDEINNAFLKIGQTSRGSRAAWAGRIDQTLQQRQFSAARGYLLAAPEMLNDQDARAIRAAAAAEDYGSEDQRLARAALLFLPDNVRANYERAIDPPRPDIEDEIPASDPLPETDEPVGAEAIAATARVDPLSQRRAFNMLGDSEDLARRTQRWIAGEQVDDLQLRLRALGLIVVSTDSPDKEAFAEAVSILRGAQRAGRLNDRFVRYLRSRIEDALPVLSLKENLAGALEPVLTTSQRSERVLDAYRATVNLEATQRLTRDMSIIARLAELTSASGAIGLVEQVSSPDDMRRILLITEAGGDRSVALSQEMGPQMLGLAQIGVKWTMGLVLQVMALMALGMALVWTTLSAFTQAETVRIN